jgi:exodeoxyribonuclease VII small subunit
VSTSPSPTDITFAEAYDELKSITTKLNNEEIEADALVELLRRGKGLEAVLREHLTNIEQEVTAIENGEDVTQFRIIGSTDSDDAHSHDGSADDDGFNPTPPAAGEDDIPF